MSSRVDLLFGFHSRNQIAKLVNGALACAYVPIDEDSMGYVTMEAFAAAKAVVTTQDSGGVLELVRDGETGFIAEPDSQSLAARLDQLAGDTGAVREMGRAAKSVLDAKALSWGYTIERLLSD
jgi:glycosyltransferase involved in cell wall biosynthesis